MITSLRVRGKYQQQIRNSIYDKVMEGTYYISVWHPVRLIFNLELWMKRR